MRRLTRHDLANITGIPIKGYQVEAARIKKGQSDDSDHYGIILARNAKGEYVTWQFHFQEDESISVYWGHYTMDPEAAFRDYNTRDVDCPLKKYKVTITETLKLDVTIEAGDPQQAVQIVSDGWHNSKYILDSENFIGVDFETVPALDDQILGSIP